MQLSAPVGMEAGKMALMPLQRSATRGRSSSQQCPVLLEPGWEAFWERRGKDCIKKNPVKYFG